MHGVVEVYFYVLLGDFFLFVGYVLVGMLWVKVCVVYFCVEGLA